MLLYSRRHPGFISVLLCFIGCARVSWVIVACLIKEFLFSTLNQTSWGLGNEAHFGQGKPGNRIQAIEDRRWRRKLLRQVGTERPGGRGLARGVRVTAGQHGCDPGPKPDLREFG
jgi:hypothetical protein